MKLHTHVKILPIQANFYRHARAKISTVLESAMSDQSNDTHKPYALDNLIFDLERGDHNFQMQSGDLKKHFLKFFFSYIVNIWPKQWENVRAENLYDKRCYLNHPNPPPLQMGKKHIF